MSQSIEIFPAVDLPVTVHSGDSTAKSRRFLTHTERFSQRYKDKLDNRVLRELGGAFSKRSGLSIGNVRASERAILEFCRFLATRPKPLASLTELTSADIHEHVQNLKRKYPPRLLRSGKMGNPWYVSQYRPLKATLLSFLPSGIWPHVDRPIHSPNEGHSPHAMKQILRACQLEIDRIRAKKGAWADAAARGTAKEQDWIDLWTAGTRSKLTETQVDELVRLENETLRPTNKELAKRFGVSDCAIAAQRKLIQQGIRPKGQRNQDYIDLTLDDVIATFAKYLPDWPVVGNLADPDFGRPQHRVYDSPRGILLGVFQSREEADACADRVGASVVVSGLSRASSFELMNPAEQFLKRASGGKDNRGHLSNRLKELLPNGAVCLAQNYFPTSYDWAVIFLYWCALTGWNQETIMSVTALQLKQMSEGINEISPLSADHVTIKGTGAIKKNEPDTNPSITGGKMRGQRDSKASLFTHVSDKGEKYGLYGVLLDYYKLTLPIRKHLRGDEVNHILVGVFSSGGKAAGRQITSMGPGSEPSALRAGLLAFFKNHEIYEDEENCIRIDTTTASLMRTTYFSTLQHLKVPITAQMFMGAHKSLDTTMLSYADDGVSRKILKRRAREDLNALEGQAFTGKLKRYEQDEKKIKKTGAVVVFHHRESEISMCANPYDPTWEGHELYLALKDDGSVAQACDFFHMCLLCKQCVVTTTTLPYLLRWQSDIKRWKKEAGAADFTAHMLHCYQAIAEILELCEASGEPWRNALVEAEALATDDNFISPMLWRHI